MDIIDLHLNTFLAANGISLCEFGSAEFGLPKERCMEFLKMLLEVDRRVLGIEVWNKINDYKYSINSLGGWYSSNKNIMDCYYDALNFLECGRFADGDIMTIQFG